MSHTGGGLALSTTSSPLIPSANSTSNPVREADNTIASHLSERSLSPMTTTFSNYSVVVLASYICPIRIGGELCTPRVALLARPISEMVSAGIRFLSEVAET